MSAALLLLTLSTSTLASLPQDLSTSFSTVLPTQPSSTDVSLEASTISTVTPPSFDVSREASTYPTVLPTPPPPHGCSQCDRRRCPVSVHECPVNVGLVRDACECCSNGVCGLREGARCFSENLVGDLPAYNRALGSCGRGMECVLRTDLSPTENPEALCSCIEAGPVCGTDNRTHQSSCQLVQESDDLWIKYRGPCRAAAWIVSAPEPEVTVSLGASVGLSCESQGYPTPRLHWDRTEVTSPDDTDTRLPGDDPSVSVQLRGGPEPFMASAWLQITATTWKHNASYACVAVNSEGVARAFTRIIVRSISEYPDAG